MLQQWAIQKSGYLYNRSFFNSSDLGLQSKFYFAFFCWYFVPWISIFLQIRIRIQEAKILRTLSTDLKAPKLSIHGLEFLEKYFPHPPLTNFLFSKIYPCFNKIGISAPSQSVVGILLKFNNWLNNI